MRCIRLPNGNLLIPAELDDPAAGFGMREVGPDHPDYATWLACSEEGEDPRLSECATAPPQLNQKMQRVKS
jgi:hypothetical protein